MKILNAEEIRDWDQYSILHEPVSSIELMERAAKACVEWMEKQGFIKKQVSIFCGKGNNGGDGLAIARLLAGMNCFAKVYILEFGHKGTEDFQANLARLHEYPAVDIRYLQTEEHFHSFEPGEIIIDALFGSGLNRGLEGVTAQLVHYINSSNCEVISIDIPSGLFVDRSSTGQIIIRAHHTLSFQCYKLALLVAENAPFIGNVHILDIGLDPDYYSTLATQFEIIDDEIIRLTRKKRDPNSHKGNFGHSLLIAGSKGKIGASVLAARACLRSGVGLLTCHIPSCGYEIMQSSVPEAMVSTDSHTLFPTHLEDDLARFTSIGIGPGIGTAKETTSLLRWLFESYRRPMVIDADALNIIAANNELFSLIPPQSILCPHPKEFERLFGDTPGDFEKINIAIKKAAELNVVIILKGHHTLVALPGGIATAKGYFNSTGNAGMATGGSGDVLTGILTGLLAQGYSSAEAAVIGVYLHGMAGDIAAAMISMEGMIASDIVENLGKAFLHFETA